MVELLPAHDVPLSLVSKQESGGLGELATVHLVLVLVITGFTCGRGSSGATSSSSRDSPRASLLLVMRGRGLTSDMR